MPWDHTPSVAECSRSYFSIKLGTLVPSSPDVMCVEDFGSMRGRRVKNGARESFQICDVSLDWFWFQGTQNLLCIPQSDSCWWCAGSWTNRLATPLVCSPISTNLRSGEKTTFCVFTLISHTDKPYSM